MPTYYAYAPYFRGLTFTNDSFHSTPSSQLIGGQPPQSYGAFPSNSGIQPSRGSSRYASPGPTAAFPELLPPLSPQLFSRPPVPPIGPTLVPTPTRSPKKGSKGLVIWLTIVFLQVALIAYRSDTLAKWINLENKASSLSSRRTSLVAERQKSEQEREKLRHERELWDREVPEDRVPQGAYWKPIWPANYCLAYGKRGYWGMLMDVPDGWSAMDACMNMPAQIKGVTIRRPHSCIFADGYPHILGYWMVDWGQEDCKPWYKDIRDTVSPRSPSVCRLWSRSCVCWRDVQTIDPASLDSRQMSRV